MRALSVSVIFLAVALVVAAFVWNTQSTLGSVNYGGEYNAVEVTSSTGTTTAKTRIGSIGSVVIDVGGSTGGVFFYATTSNATNTADLLFGVDGAAAEGTYTYDVVFGGGLLIEERNYDGEAVVTWR